MRHIVYDTAADTFPIAILIKGAAFSDREIDRAYVQPLVAHGVNRNDIIIVAAEYNDAGKAPVTFIKEQLNQMLPALASVGTRYILCADANYFKVLANQRKADPHLGYSLKCGIKDYDHMDVVLGINHKALIHNPANEPKLTLSLDTFAQVILGSYEGLGNDIIHSAHYPTSVVDIKDALKSLHQYPMLTADLEAFSLKFYDAGIGSAAFAWSAHEGIAFPCDYKARKAPSRSGNWGENQLNPEVRNLVRDFLESYQGTLVWHNGPYDLKVLIYNLWMEHPLDTNGMLKGLEIMTRHWHDTKVVAYLATNSAAGNKLSLKELAHPFAGNWAEDVTDIRKIPQEKLLQYNLIDALSTFWVLEKYYPIMVADQQEELYNTLMMPSQKTIIQMELVGMPMDADSIQEAKAGLELIVEEQMAIFHASPLIDSLNRRLQQDAMVAANAKLKVKQHPIEHFADVVMNPNSNLQLQKLLYEQLELPILDTTKGRQPATGIKTLQKLVNHTQDPEQIAIIEALIVLSGAAKILSSFIPAFEKAIRKKDGVVWLHGNFNLGGTISGRLSSSEPNLQNLPSGSTYGKLIKDAFRAPKGWIFCGADFSSLEDRINALLTGDPNKIKVYTDGFDSHALRTYSYWPHMFPDLDPNDPVSINTIKQDANGKEHPLRGKSKAPSFALQYLGTWSTLVRSSGFTPAEAKAIEANFHLLYGVSMDWVKEQIQKASECGYATAAFGLRIRTPLLARTYLGKSSTPREAEAEGRSLGNAVSGQSYGLLTNRAANAVMERVWASEYRFDILPSAMIHDAIYFLARDNVDVITWLNQVLIEEMEWQELPEIQHDEVKLGAELDLYWPSWANGITLPNGATPEEIRALCQAAKQELLDKETA